MGPADTDTDIFSQPIFLPIPIQIYLHQHIGHRYRYQYFYFCRYLADNWYFDRYMPIFWPISMYFSRYFADTNITDIQSSRYRCRYLYGWYQYPVYQYRYVSIGQIYQLTVIYRSNSTSSWILWSRKGQPLFLTLHVFLIKLVIAFMVH